MGEYLEDCVLDLDLKCSKCGGRRFGIYSERKVGYAAKSRGHWEVQTFYNECDEILIFECVRCGHEEDIT